MQLYTRTGNKKVIYFSCFLFFCLFIFHSCSTEKNAALNKAFHYTTTKFNGYFHGKEALKLAKKNLDKNHVDNFEEILNIYRYGDKTQAEAEFSNLNRAISKARKMITKHSMKFKVKGATKEANGMIDDCYFLLGQAMYLKMQYDSSIQTFKFIINQFEKGKTYYPAHFELIKAYIAKKNFVDAETKIKFLEEDKNLPKKHKGQFAVVKAHYHLKNKNYKEAIKSLELALTLVKKAKTKTRLSYILAQLYLKENNSQKAAELFSYVAKKSLAYDMAFSAKMNLALAQNTKNQGSMISELNRMLKDKKNSDYKDQIYYVLAKVYEKNGEGEKALEMYKMAAATSVNNPKQKAYAQLAIADYYFKVPQYLPAQAYYDSCLAGLPETYAEKSKVEAKAKNLNELVVQINIIQREDSLQKLAGMSDEQKQKVIEGIIDKLNEAEEKQAMAEKAKLEQIKAAAATQTNTGGWLFDNPNLLASANADFVGIWGNRKLEDNWRRSNKATVVLMDNADNSGKTVDENGNPVLAENKTVDFYLKDIPSSPESISESNEKIKKAIYTAAVIFKEKLNDLAKANEYFEELNRRFPENENKVTTLYQLYRNYENSGNTVKAEEKKLQILSEFPNSEYAQLIKNPHKGAEEEQTKKQFNAYYEQSLGDFKAGQYQKVINDVDLMNQQQPNNPLKGNFALLRAFAIGKTKGKEAFELELKQIYTEYQGSAVGNDVKEILDELQAGRMEKAGVEKMKEESQKSFAFGKEEAHLVVIIFSGDLVNSNELQEKIGAYNQAQYSENNLNIKQEPWKDKDFVIKIEGLQNAEQASKYKSNLAEAVLKGINQLGEIYFPISEGNYQKLVQFKEVEKYLKFYKENY